jgi:Kdo2-lipid IVA lauroyltransferase/acyltransferase
VDLSDLRDVARYDGLFWRRLAYLGSAHGPAWWRRLSPSAFGAAFYAVLGAQRRAVRANQRRIRPERDAVAIERATLETFLAFARCLTDSLEAAGPRPPDFAVEAIGEEHLAEAHRAGHGAVMVTAHVGNWDLFGRIVAAKGFPVTIAMARERNESVRPFVEGLRDGAAEVLYTDATAFAALDLLRALRQNRILAVQIDRPAGGDGDLRVPFFGRLVPFPVGPFLLAQAAGAPVLPVLSFLVGHHRYRVEVGGPIRIPRGSGRQAAESALGRVVRLLEANVREHPEQWFHFTEIGGEGFAAAAAEDEATKSFPRPRDASPGTGSS